MLLFSMLSAPQWRRGYQVIRLPVYTSFGMCGTGCHESLFIIIPSPKWNHFDTCTSRSLHQEVIVLSAENGVLPVAAAQEHIVAARNGFIGCQKSSGAWGLAQPDLVNVLINLN